MVVYCKLTSFYIQYALGHTHIYFKINITIKVAIIPLGTIAPFGRNCYCYSSSSSSSLSSSSYYYNYYNYIGLYRIQISSKLL